MNEKENEQKNSINNIKEDNELEVSPISEQEVRE